MAEATVFGKYLRKMRIDCSEVLGTMAKRLGVSPAYLSAIENNVREIPEGFVEKIIREYNVSDIQQKELYLAEAETKKNVTVPLENANASEMYYETALLFARDFSKLTESQIIQMNKLLNSFKTS